MLFPAYHFFMTYGYIRVSTSRQTVANQKFEISEFCVRNGLAVDSWIEETISGTVDPSRRELGRLLSDIKRGDIADTAKAYARAHFAGEFETDIITINPYMGFDTLKPFTEYCKPTDGSKAGKGI